MKNFYYMPLLVSITLCLFACTVGPDYVSPKTPDVSQYTGEGQRKFTRQLSEQWWKNFQSPALNELVALSTKNNYSLQAMRETLQQAQENIKATQGQRLPQISASAGPGYEKYGVEATGNTNTIPAFYYYSFGPSINWTLDLFGKTRRTIEQQKAMAQYQKQELRATQLTLNGHVVMATFTLAALNAQVTHIKQMIDIDKKYLQKLQQGISKGSVTRKDIIQAETQLHADEALLPPLLQQLTLEKNELNILVGKFPAHWQAPNFDLNNFTLPKTLPLSLPSQLVHQRPDILAAEALLHASSAAVGVATANLYPQLTLSANIAQEALSPGQLFDNNSTAASVFTGLTAPIFSGGMLESQKRAAEHAYKASYANYQDVVVRAFVQVSNVLHALNQDDIEVLTQEKSIADAQTTLKLMHMGNTLGSANQLELLMAQRNVQQIQLNYLQAIAQRYHDTAQLYLVMGSK